MADYRAELVWLTSQADVAKATIAGWVQFREFFRAVQASELQRLSPVDVGNSLN